MLPAAVLSVLVDAQGVGPTNAKLNSVQSTLRKTEAVADSAGSSMVRSGRRIEKAGAGISKFGKAATKYYATPLLLAAGASVYFGQKYEKAMLMVQTHTDTNRRDLALYKHEILEMGRSGKYTQGPAELGEAMYHIASDGYKGVKATTMLRKSADLAMVGQSDLAESTYALVSAMKTGIRGTETSGQAINTLNAIVGAGDMKMQELVGAMSTGVLPAAKAMGLSLKDVGVAEDIMTQRGVPAQQSAYRLAMTFQMLIPHTEKAEDAFERLGLKNKALVKQFEEHPKEGLLSAFELLEEHLKKVEGPKGVDQIQTIEEIFGGGRTSRGAITLLQNLDSVRETYGRINQLAGETPKKIAQAKAAPVNKLRESWVQVETVLTEVGSDLIPMVAEGITYLAHSIQDVNSWFHRLPSGTQATIIKLLALTVALAYLIRIVGFFVKSFGMLFEAIGTLIGWFAKEEEATASVAASQEVLQATYAETAVAAEASAAAQTAAIEEVAAAQKLAEAEQIVRLPIGGFRTGNMDQLMPYAEDGAQMSLFATPAAKAAMTGEAAVVAEDAGAAAAPAFASSFAAGLPEALSVLAGPAALLALPVAVTGFLAYKDITAGPEPTKYQRKLGASHRHVKETHEAERESFGRAGHFDRALVGMKQKEVRANHQLAKAEKELRQARHGAGPDAHNLAKAELGVWKAKSRVNAKIEEQHHLEKKHGFALLGAKHKAVEAVAASKIEISSLHQYEQHLQKVLTKEHEHGAFRGKLSEQTEDHIKALESVESRYTQAKMRELRAVEEAEKYVGSKFAKGIAKMTLVQAKFGKHYQGLKRAIESNPIKMREIETQHALNAWTTKFQLPFQKKSHEAATKSARSFLDWEETATGAMGSVGAEMNKMLSAMGQKPLSFSAHTEKHAKTHKARGGQINVGAASGDSVHALLEKGEYVVNREAVSKVGVHKLNELNFGKAPRFQEGGAVGGNMGMAIAKANEIDSEHFPYLWGGGHGGFSGPYDCSGAVSAVLHAANLLPQPMVSGDLASYGEPGPGPITIYANAVHAFMKIAGKFFGTSGSNPGGGAGWFPSSVGLSEVSGGDSGGAFQVRHPSGVIAEQLKKVMIEGPEGQLKKIGQSSVDHVYAAANKYIQAHMPGGFGGGDPNLEGVGGPVASQAAQISKASHSPHVSTLALFEALWAESSMGESSPGNVLQGLGPGGAPIGTAAEEISGFLTGHPRWTGTAAIPLASSGLPANAIAQLVQASGVGEGNEGRANYLPQKGRALASMAEFGLKNGGLIGSPVEAMLSKGGMPEGTKEKASIEKSIAGSLKGLGEGKHLPKYQAALKKVGRRISKIDLPHSQMERLGQLSSEAERFSEFAGNASAMTRSVENPATQEEEIIQGIFKGGNEGSWLEKELNALVALRKQVIGSHEAVSQKTLPRVMKLMHHTQHRLREAQKAIREDEAKKRELEKKIKDLEKAQNDNIKKLEKEKKELEAKLDKLQGAKNPNHAAISQVRDEIRSKNEAMGSTNKEASNNIKEDREKIKDIEKDVKVKQRIEGGAKTLIGQLDEKRTSLYDTMSNLYGQGGEFEGTGLSFYGLEQVQGKGGTTEDIPNPPEFGSVGGEIFDVQNRLREIQEELERKPSPKADEGSTEIEELEKEIATEWRKRYEVSQAQFSVMSNFPSVGEVAAPVLPYAGSFATGGSALVAATVGERGREVAIMPNGSRVVPEHDAKEAIARMGGGGPHSIVFEEVHFHEHEGKVSGRINGEEFESDVNNIQRKTSRKSMTRTPGGRGRVR
jgi:TP901 family phage tail tape measure protein